MLSKASFLILLALLTSVSSADSSPVKLKRGKSSTFRNPGFETETLKPGWSQKATSFSSGGQFAVISPGLRGSSYALYFKGGDFVHESYVLRQKLDTIPNTTYTVTFDTLANGTMPWPVNIRFGPASNNKITTLKAKPGLHTNSVSLFTSGSSSLFRLQVEPPPRYTNLTFDNFVIQSAAGDDPC